LLNLLRSSTPLITIKAEEKAQKVQELKERLARRKEEKRLAEIEEAKEKEKVCIKLKPFPNIYNLHPFKDSESNGR
jgi:hypothetical protein